MRGYVFPEAGAIAVKQFFHRPVEIEGDLRHVFLRNVGHVGFAATAGLQADERDENIVFGKLDLGEKLFLCVNDSRNFHESPYMIFNSATIPNRWLSGVQGGYLRFWIYHLYPSGNHFQKILKKPRFDYIPETVTTPDNQAHTDFLFLPLTFLLV